jgi:hypothetical protein
MRLAPKSRPLEREEARRQIIREECRAILGEVPEDSAGGRLAIAILRVTEQPFRNLAESIAVYEAIERLIGGTASGALN